MIPQLQLQENNSHLGNPGFMGMNVSISSYQYPYHIAKAQQKEIPTSPFKFDRSAVDLLLDLWVPKLTDGESINPGIDNGELRGDVMR